MKLHGIKQWGQKLFIFSILGVMSTTSLFANADEIASLRREIVAMQRNYQTQINELKQQVEALTHAQTKTPSAVATASSNNQMGRGITAQYIGRDHDAFGKGGLELSHSSTDSKVTLGGYVDHEFENFENSNSTFDQHRWILNIGAEITDRLRFYSEYEIEHGGPNTAESDGEAKVEQAFVDYLINDTFNVRAGAILVPFGRTNIYHDSDLRDTTERPLVARDIIPTTWTESGAGAWGAFDINDIGISYEAYIINGLDDGFSDTGLRGARSSLKSDNNNNKALVARVAVSPAIGQEFAISGYTGKYDSTERINGLGLDCLLTWNAFEFVGEYARFDVGQATGSADIADTFEGYYAQINYHFWFEGLNDTFLGRSFEDPTFTFFTRYGQAQIDDDADASIGDNEEHRWTVGFNYRPVENFVVKLEYIRSDTDVESLEKGDNDGVIASVAMGF